MTTTVFLDPDSYANSAGAAHPKNRNTQNLSGFLLRPEFRRREATRLGAPEGPLELAVAVEPELQEPGRLRQSR